MNKNQIKKEIPAVHPFFLTAHNSIMPFNVLYIA
jgi:hypothetical protein